MRRLELCSLVCYHPTKQSFLSTVQRVILAKRTVEAGSLKWTFWAPPILHSQTGWPVGLKWPYLWSGPQIWLCFSYCEPCKQAGLGSYREVLWGRCQRFDVVVVPAMSVITITTGHARQQQELCEWIRQPRPESLQSPQSVCCSPGMVYVPLFSFVSTADIGTTFRLVQKVKPEWCSRCRSVRIPLHRQRYFPSFCEVACSKCPTVTSSMLSLVIFITQQQWKMIAPGMKPNLYCLCSHS